jgi:phage shock protein PspC (stress-responsive transcriptional regulator)
MTSTPPWQAPKKLERSRSNRVLGGVCAGVANYLNMDPTLIRVLTVIITLFTGVPIVVYLVLLFVIPEEESPTQQIVPPPSPGAGQTIPPTRQSATDPVWGPGGAPWEQQPRSAQPASADPSATTQPPAQPARSETEPTQPIDRPDDNAQR